MSGRKTSQIWKISKKEFERKVNESLSWNGLVRACNFGHSGNSRTVKNRVKEENLDVSHFKGSGWAKGTKQTEQQKNFSFTLEEILVIDSEYKDNQCLKRRLINNNLLKDECSVCKLLPIWNNEPLVLQLDHINGNTYDNRIENLRVICPNCHSQTDTFCGKTKFRHKDFDKRKHKKKFKKVLQQLLKKSKQLNCIDCGDEIGQRANRCVKCHRLSTRKKTRPQKDQLLKEVKELGYSATGRKYGVSDNAIRKWIKST